MILDSSAIIALLTKEADAQAIARAIVADSKRIMSTVNALEVTTVMLHRYQHYGVVEWNELRERLAIELVPFDQEQYKIAQRAYQEFGKGQHPAKLNIGDCAAYALSDIKQEPLLFKGQDFSQTDVLKVAW